MRESFIMFFVLLQCLRDVLKTWRGRGRREERKAKGREREGEKQRTWNKMWKYRYTSKNNLRICSLVGGVRVNRSEERTSVGGVARCFHHEEIALLCLFLSSVLSQCQASSEMCQFELLFWVFKLTLSWRLHENGVWGGLGSLVRDFTQSFDTSKAHETSARILSGTSSFFPLLKVWI